MQGWGRHKNVVAAGYMAIIKEGHDLKKVGKQLSRESILKSFVKQGFAQLCQAEMI